MTDNIKIKDESGRPLRTFFVFDQDAFGGVGPAIGEVGVAAKARGIFGPKNELETVDMFTTEREAVRFWKGEEWTKDATESEIEAAYDAMPWEDIGIVEIVPIGPEATEVSADDA